jgi:hypothetical protein
VSTPVSSLATLRRLLSDRFPQAARPQAATLPTGIRRVDDEAGGLPRHALTELVCGAPSCGGQLFVGQLLHVVRAAAGRSALVDATDSFDPASWPPDDLRALVWLRCRNVTEAMAVADLLARDANLEFVILDLRRVALRELRRIPARTWYRLQRAMEQTDAVLLALTPVTTVPSAQLRLMLDRPLSDATSSAPRPELTRALAVAVQRQRVSANLAVG